MSPERPETLRKTPSSDGIAGPRVVENSVLQSSLQTFTPQVSSPALYPIIPEELWHSVAQNIPSKSDLSALSRACRSLRFIAQSFLFLRADISDSSTLCAFTRTIQDDGLAHRKYGHGSLARRVKELRVIFDPQCFPDDVDRADAVTSLEFLLRHCSQLRVLSLPEWTTPLSDVIGLSMPCRLTALAYQSDIERLHVWGAVTLPPLILPKLISFTGDLCTALSVLPGGHVLDLQLVGCVDVEEMAASLQAISKTSLSSLSLRPSSDCPQQYLPVIRRFFPQLCHLTISRFPREFLRLVLSNKERFPQWSKLRTLYLYCEHDPYTPSFDETPAAASLLGRNPSLQSVHIRAALPFELCLSHI
ncbi:hypothetical protein AURDEDRAFT_176508 [Auricularia subglabra TFB-10046 SS5]|uniref:F-box domain-containing protein n=1 Tax=Auricularia subglabra (strain TFB-10046 / SS5) TaxID=717982 RepID=J0WR84_AURST|nr:hypothetical protein AURDEDRAFT_176508 [Auricularia subglabra TFB-10046 SS5]